MSKHPIGFEPMVLSAKIIKRLPVIAGPNWPHSLGYRVFLVTNHRLANKASRTKKKDLKRMRAPDFDGAQAVWDVPERAVVIYINKRIETKVRLIEVIAHEVSHTADAFFSRMFAQEPVDTEIRAYTIDWLVGLTLHHFKI